jgi:FeS assembly SUF system protein
MRDDSDISRKTETLQMLTETQMRTQPMNTSDEPSSSASVVGSLNDAIITALRSVHDPEIPVNIYDLGLIYRIELKDHESVDIDMTLTAPGCPVASEILSWVRKAVSAVDGIKRVNVNLVFDPPWDQEKMSEEAKLELGLM